MCSTSDGCELRAQGLRTSQFAPIHPRSLEGRGPIDARGEVGEAQNHLWFPNVASSTCSPATRTCRLGPLWPTGPETCAGYLDYWFGGQVDAGAGSTQLFVFDEQVGAEDTALVEAAQRGTSAGLIDRGWVLGATETLIGHFQDYLRERLELDRPSAASSER